MPDVVITKRVRKQKIQVHKEHKEPQRAQRAQPLILCDLCAPLGPLCDGFRIPGIVNQCFAIFAGLSQYFETPQIHNGSRHYSLGNDLF